VGPACWGVAGVVWVLTRGLNPFVASRVVQPFVPGGGVARVRADVEAEAVEGVAGWVFVNFYVGCEGYFGVGGGESVVVDDGERGEVSAFE
jgi:hypothetical protein